MASAVSEEEVRVETGWQLLGRALRLSWWAWALVVALIAALGSGNLLALDYVHVLTGGAWTGIDLFLGFILGPVLRRLSLEGRRAVVSQLMPRTLVFLPILAAVATTSGYYLATRLGFSQPGPLHGWFVAAGVVALILFVQGIGILLPTNLQVFLEIQKAQPDLVRVGRTMRRYLAFTAVQGLMQLVIIFIMANFIF
ncbi:MAG: hypothetical protein ACYCOS_02385 [Sulfobacillus sp.]